jgi:oxygen-dependent protoporphyrinogen oxidase
MSQSADHSLPVTHAAPVVIVGGGIAGLSTAWGLQKQGVPYTVLEQSARWGGKVCTERVHVADVGEFVVEGGPDSFITQKPGGVQLARELGLGDDLIGVNDAMRKVYVVHKGKPTPMPDGVLLIVPTRFKPFVFSPLISPWGKLRMGMDLFIPARKGDADETLADFVRRRLGSEALDKIAEPLLSGIYNAEAEKQSVLATFPRLRALEVEYGSLTKGMLASRRRPHNNGAAAAAPSAKPLPLFMSLRGGTEQLAEALVARLTGDLRLNTAVDSIVKAPDGGYRLHLGDGSTLDARAVVLATPTWVAAGLLRDLAPQAAALLDAVRYVSTGTISLAYRTEQMARPLKGFGLVVPSSEKRPINAITWSSAKFAHRAPDNYALLRVFFGGSRSPQSMDLDDEALLAMVRGELRAFLGIEADPLFHRIYRWRNGNPQYDVGHLERVAAVEAALPPSLYVTGSPYRGVGIPDCVKQGQDTAQVVEQLIG